MKAVERLALDASGRLPKEHPMQPESLLLAGEAQSNAQRYADAAKTFERLLAEHPKHRDAHETALALARALLNAGRLDEGIGVVERAIREHHTSPSYAYMNELRWKLYHAKGDFDGMMRCVTAVETSYPLKLTNPALTRKERDFFDLLLDYNGFRKGYTLFAKGDLQAARTQFQKHASGLDEKQKVLAQEGKSLNPGVEVHRNRSLANLDFLEHCGGLPAPLDLDLGDSWLTPNPVLLRESKGKVVAIVFRGAGDTRSEPFLPGVWQFVRSRPDMAMAVIHYQKPGIAPDQQKADVAEEMARAGYDGPAGFDPDIEGKNLFHAYHVKVGSATFVVADRQGELVWFMEDPRGIDVQFATRLLERVAGPLPAPTTPTPPPRPPAPWWIPAALAGLGVLAVAAVLVVAAAMRRGKARTPVPGNAPAREPS
jgi:tetratricopeptide (TPR) repeat protein